MLRALEVVYQAKRSRLSMKKMLSSGVTPRPSVYACMGVAMAVKDGDEAKRLAGRDGETINNAKATLAETN